MGNRRTAKVAEAIREVVSSTILFELRDPRIKNVTVLGVDVPGDLRSAKVRVSVMGDDTQQRLTMQGINAARGFLQGKVGDRLNLRFTPVLSFEIDEGVKKAAEASRILTRLAEERQAQEREQADAEGTESLLSGERESPSSSAIAGNESAADIPDRPLAPAQVEDND